jgi:hypothetical protein
LPAAHFDRNESHLIYGTGHWNLEKITPLCDKPYPSFGRS